MQDSGPKPPLRPLHSGEVLVKSKLAKFDKLETFALIQTLRPGVPGSLKTRPDGTMLDGHHRVAVLKARGIAIDGLPREIIEKQENGFDVP